MLKQLPYGDGAKARVADARQIQEVTDGLIEADFPRLKQLHNAHRRELFSKASDAEKIGCLRRGSIGWSQRIGMVKNQVSVPGDREGTARDVSQRHEIGHFGVQCG